MQETKHKYVVIASLEGAAGWEESLTGSMGVCKNAKKAYEIALFLGRISKPDLGYRKVLETLNKKGAVELGQQGEQARATIVKVREY